MDDFLSGGSGTNLVTKFPPFSSVSVLDNVYAALWAGIVLDLEAAVEEFLMFEGWEYVDFVQLAERRELVGLFRCGFVASLEKTVRSVGVGTTRGRHRDQLHTYRKIVNIIFNVAKDIWLEPKPAQPCRNHLNDLKRSVAGLYILYYLWHNQIPSDKYKVPIKYTPEDDQRAKAVKAAFLRLENQIPNSIVVKNTYMYLIVALSKRNAFNYSYVTEEPKLDFFSWQYIHLKKCVVRQALTAISSNNRCNQVVPVLENACSLLLGVLGESQRISCIPTQNSIFLRRMVPVDVVKNAIKFDVGSCNTFFKLPFDYGQLAAKITEAVSKNGVLIQQPLLTLDTLLQSDSAPAKIQSLGLKKVKKFEAKYIYSRREYENHKITFNRICEEQRADMLKAPSTREYRAMSSAAWFFVLRQFHKVFEGTKQNGLVGSSHSPLKNIFPDDPSISLVSAKASFTSVRKPMKMVAEKNLDSKKRPTSSASTWCFVSTVDDSNPSEDIQTRDTSKPSRIRKRPAYLNYYSDNTKKKTYSRKKSKLH